MKDFETDVLEQYHIEVKGTRKTRGAILCDTDREMCIRDRYNPDYVLILSGDHIYKMDYEVMLDFHKENHADVTIATMPVPLEEASRFGIVITCLLYTSRCV